MKQHFKTTEVEAVLYSDKLFKTNLAKFNLVWEQIWGSKKYGGGGEGMEAKPSKWSRQDIRLNKFPRGQACSKGVDGWMLHMPPTTPQSASLGSHILC